MRVESEANVHVDVLISMAMTISENLECYLIKINGQSGQLF